MNEDNTGSSVIQDLRARVADGASGQQLPSVRALMAAHRVAPATVQTALRRLAAEGLVEIRSGRGSYVAAAAAPQPADLSWQAVALGASRPGQEALAGLQAVPRAGAIPLASGYFDADLQPVGALGAALARAARRPAAWERVPIEGRHDLREWFAAQAGGGLRASDMTICSGGQPALATAFRGLARPGDALLVESPTYLGAIAAGRDAGLRVEPVPADDDGVRPDLLRAAFDRTGARLFFCQPLHANPHGGVLAADRRAEVLQAVADAGAFLIEDDWSRGLTLDGDEPAPLAAEDQHGHVVYLRSLTKIAAPGLRVAAIGARGIAGQRLRAARTLDDFFVAGPLQDAAIDLVTAPSWRRHLGSLRTALRRRRDALLAALAEHLPNLQPPVVPRGGLHLWVPLPAEVDEAAVVAAAGARDVLVFAGSPWFAAEPPAGYLRLSYAAAVTEQYDEAVRRLAAAVASVTS